MTYAANLWIYFFLLFGIIIIPGMDMLFVTANALTNGPKSGLLATAGIMLGGAVHTLFGALLVTVLVNVSPQFFSPLVFVGAAYMAWIGYTLLVSTIRINTADGQAAPSGWVAFRQGAITCLLNPKAYLFVMSVYPQFIKPAFGPVWSQAVIMGILTLVTQGAIYGTIAIAAGKTRSLLSRHPVAIIYTGRVTGLAFLVVSAFTLLHFLVPQA